MPDDEAELQGDTGKVKVQHPPVPHPPNALLMSSRTCLITATMFGFLAVLLGAFGAHQLSGPDGHLERAYRQAEDKNVAGRTMRASYKYYQDYQTSVRYHMWHALALAVIGLWKRERASKALSIAAWSFTVGIVLFSGALYLLVIAGPKFGGIPWGAIAPIGGTALLTGWIAALVAACQETSDT